MIAADSSAWIDYFKGKISEGALKLEQALKEERVLLPVPVRFELLSGPKIFPELAKEILALPTLDLTDGFWDRAATLRRNLLKKEIKARSMDCLIAQNCMDSHIPLIANDKDFKHFQKSGLILA